MSVVLFYIPLIQSGHERRPMKKTYHTKKTLLLWMLAATIAMTPITSATPPAVRAQETNDVEATEISLAYTSNITVDTEGSRLCISGEADTTYHVPVNITASCTVILNHACNSADITIADGVDAKILLRGTNALHDICALGGSATHVSICGTSVNDMLTANNIACSDGGSTATGAEVLIENCTVACTNLACGGDGKDTPTDGGTTVIAGASPGSNASPCVTVRSADLTVNGNLACGGDGQQSVGSWSVTASDGGSSGAVVIDSSRVTVSGNVSMGGKGGNGSTGSSNYNSKAGDTKSASPVTIRNHSIVNVSGNVASQQNLPKASNGGKQAGLHGVTVTVCDSELMAKDIASGGDGHEQVIYNVYSGSGSGYEIYGSAGGNGGTLIADRARITCETAVCGGKAGEYQNYTMDIYGNKSGDYNCVQHPRDGNGGVVRSDNSDLTITDAAGKKGNRWDGYANASSYSECVFLGGTLRGTVYGSVVTTDMTSILKGGFVADKDIRNSEESSCAACVLQTGTDMGSQTVQICANALTGTVTLDDSGSIHTYLSVGKQSLKLSGASMYAGTYMVRRAASNNIFQMRVCGKICVDHGGAEITKDAYTYQDETCSYSGAYTVTGHSEDAILTVASGKHRLILQDTSFDTLNVKGASEVVLQPEGLARIGTINVESGAALFVEGIGEIYADAGGFSAGECHGVLHNDAGARIYPVTILFEEPGTYRIKLNEEELTVRTDEAGLAYFLLAEGDYDLCIDREPFYFLADLSVTSAQQLAQADLTLCADISRGDLVIEDHAVTLGEDRVQSDADVCVIKSTDEAHDVYVEKKDAVITFEDPAADLQVHLPQDFEGQLCNTSGVPLQVITVHTGYPDQKLTLKLDGQEYVITTDSEGNFSFLAAAGSHSMEITIDGTTYRCVHPFFVSESETGSYSIADDMTSDPDTLQGTDTDTNINTGASIGTGTDKDKETDRDTGHDTNAGGKDPGTGADNSGGSSQTSDSSAGGNGQTPSSSAGNSTPASKDLPATPPAIISPVRTAPSIFLRSSLKGISMLSADEKNTYKLYTRKKIRFTVTREADTDYYYKILRRGQKNSQGQWKKLGTNTITVSGNAHSAKGQRIVFKAVNEAGSTVQETTGFVIDTRRPDIDGVKNGVFYRKRRSIRVSDNCGSCDVRLNGKKVKQSLIIQKRGIYLLTASDPAGNQRTVLFALL